MKPDFRHLASLLGRALFLEPDPYNELRESPNPLVEGLFLVIAVGLVVAVASLVGSILTWACLPDMAAVRQVAYENLVRMPWYLQWEEEAGSRFVQEFKRWYDLGWQVSPFFFGALNPLLALANVILTPVGFVLSWLVYGLLAHVVARLLKGRATLSQTLGCTALAVAPQLLRLVTVLPFVTVSLAVGVWTLLCQYRGLKEAHALPWERAFLATVLPVVVLLLLTVLGVAALIPSVLALVGRS